MNKKLLSIYNFFAIINIDFIQVSMKLRFYKLQIIVKSYNEMEDTKSNENWENS